LLLKYHGNVSLSLNKPVGPILTLNIRIYSVLIIGLNAAILQSTYNWGAFVRDKVHLGLNYR